MISLLQHAIQCSWRLALAQIEDLKKELASVQNTTGEHVSSKSPVPLNRESLLSANGVDLESSSYISPFPKSKQEKGTPSSLFERTIDTSLFPPQDVSPLASPATKGAYSDTMADYTPPSKSKFMNEKTSSMQSVEERSDDRFVESDESSDLAFGDLRNADFFHQEYKNSLPSTPEKESYDIDDLNGQFDNFLTISKNDDKKVGTSFDAFEASFQTTFPISFSTSNSNSKQKSDKELFNDAFRNNDFGDSFFTNNSKSMQECDDVEKARSQSTLSSPSKLNPDMPIDEARDLFSVIISSKPDAQVNTESSKISHKTSQRSTRNSLPVNSARNSPSRSSPTTEQIDAPMDEARADEELHSPSLVLKRLQQRKSKPTTSPSKDFSEEMRKLDAIASSVSPHSDLETSTTSSSTTRSNRRRNVSQPISYAEPPLNSKLRRGDVFFQMKERNEDESPTSVDELKSLKERQSPTISPQLEL